MGCSTSRAKRRNQTGSTRFFFCGSPGAPEQGAHYNAQTTPAWQLQYGAHSPTDFDLLVGADRCVRQSLSRHPAKGLRRIVDGTRWGPRAQEFQECKSASSRGLKRKNRHVFPHAQTKLHTPLHLPRIASNPALLPVWHWVKLWALGEAARAGGEKEVSEVNMLPRCVRATAACDGCMRKERIAEASSQPKSVYIASF